MSTELLDHREAVAAPPRPTGVARGSRRPDTARPGGAEVGAAYRPFPSIPLRNGFHAAIEVPLLVRALRLPRGGRVLEVGCGRGVALPVLDRLLRPEYLAGADIDGAALEDAMVRLVDAGVSATLFTVDVRSLPFPEDSFDLVIDFGTCYHIARPADALAEVGRVLCPGGLFVHETRLVQRLSHPVRSIGRRLPWAAVPALAPHRSAGLWAMRRKGGAGP